MKSQLKLLIISLLIVLIVAGCSIKEVEPITDISGDETIITDEIETDIEPSPTIAPIYEHTALLTGLPLENEVTSRPIAILINNLKPARPQSGLHEADIVWEVLAEGGITRLVAIFQSTTEPDTMIGPVRSNRPYFIEIADSYNAVIAHAGASNDAYGILQKQKKPYLDEIKNAGPAYWRSSERKAPHNLYTNLTKLREQIEKKGYETEANLKGYAYTEDQVSPTSPTSVVMADKLDVKFQLDGYKVSYELDMENKQYIRSVNDEQHKDKDSLEVLAARNLVFMQTAHKVLDSEGRLEVDFKSGGDALIITDGNAKEAKWIKAEDGMFRFVISGEEVKFSPGKTFIHVLPTGKSITDHVKF